jgi:histone-lysine N-methyltransferase SETD7
LAGVRLTHEEVDSRSWAENSNTISLDEDTVLDVPLQFSHCNQYCATLGHKANHSSSPNACYDVFDHPTFGFIKSLRALCSIPPNQEITVDYGFDGVHGYPDWWNQQEQQQRRSQLKRRRSRDV